MFIVCGFDKSSAIFGANRVPEKILLLFAAAGGSLGLIAAIGFFRHKTRKPRFQFSLALIVVVQVAILRALGLLGG